MRTGRSSSSITAQYIVAEPVRAVVRDFWGRFAGYSETPPRNSIAVIIDLELRRKSVEDVRGVAQFRQEDDGASCPAPVQNFKLHIFRGIDKLNLMWRVGLRAFCKSGCGD